MSGATKLTIKIVAVFVVCAIGTGLIFLGLVRLVFPWQ